jgi:hypothetical protein
MDTFILGISIAINLVIGSLLIYFRESIKALVAIRQSKILEEYKQEIARRQRAEKVAELFARFHYKFDQYEIAKLIWELSFYLPCELVCEMSQTLVNGKTPADTMKLFVRVREHFGLKDGLTWENITYFAQLPQKQPVLE